MRQSNLNAYEWFINNVGKEISVDDLLKVLGTGSPTSGGGVSGHVSHLRTVNGLDIVSRKDGREVQGYTLVEKPKTHPGEVQEHYDRQARLAANRGEPAQPARAVAASASAPVKRGPGRPPKTATSTAAISAPAAARAAASSLDSDIANTAQAAANRAGEAAKEAVLQAAFKAANDTAAVITAAAEDTLGEVIAPPTSMGESYVPVRESKPAAAKPQKATAAGRKSTSRKTVTQKG